MLISEKKAVHGFFLLLGITILSCVAKDMSGNVWGIHSGDLFPWRHFPWVSLYPTSGLLIEWGLLVISGALLFLQKTRRWAVILASIVLLVSLSQRFSNHRSLILIFLLYLLLDHTSTSEKASLKSPGFKMIRYQMLIVYLFSALNKFQSGFLSGESLANLSQLVGNSMLSQDIINHLLTGSIGKMTSWLTVGLELTMPFFLIQIPLVGWLFAFFLHASFSVVMPGIWPFTLIMLTGATAFVGFQSKDREN